jgi:hypothetical protein
MCRDECRGGSNCNRPPEFNNWTCDSTQQFEEGYCKPTGGFTCLPSEVFKLGTRKAGDCCSATGNGNAGLECEGGLCSAFGASSNPFVCTNTCEASNDCPSGWVCLTVSNTRKVCANTATTYTCQ